MNTMVRDRLTTDFWAARVSAGEREAVYVGLLEVCHIPARIHHITKDAVYVLMNGNVYAVHPDDLRLAS